MKKAFWISALLSLTIGLLPYVRLIRGGFFRTDGFNFIFIPAFFLFFILLSIIFRLKSKGRGFWSSFWRMTIIPFLIVSISAIVMFFSLLIHRPASGYGEGVGWAFGLVIAFVVILAIFLPIFFVFGWLLSGEKTHRWAEFFVIALISIVFIMALYTKITLSPCTTQDYTMEDWGYICEAPDGF
jgi:hypothetical protein